MKGGWFVVAVLNPWGSVRGGEFSEIEITCLSNKSCDISQILKRICWCDVANYVSK